MIGRSAESLRRALHEPTGAGAHARLVLSLTHEPAPVYADEGHIAQIVLNLVINARNAMPAGSAIEVKTEVVKLDTPSCRQYPGALPGYYVAVSVRQAASDPVVAIGAGTAVAASFGAGTTQAIVSQYGGFMAVDSTAGRGAVFFVYLPCGEESASVSAAELSDAATRRSRQETILLVDDEPITRELSRDMLEREGYQVVLAADAERSRTPERAGRRQFDLLITDLVMPQISGARSGT